MGLLLEGWRVVSEPDLHKDQQENEVDRMRKKELAENVVLDRLRQRIREGFPRDKMFAEALGVTPSFLSAVLRGRRPPTAPMLKLIGVERVTIYRSVQ